MDNKKRGKNIKFISLPVNSMEQEPLCGIIHRLGSSMLAVYFAICLRVIEKGDYVATLSFADREALSALLGVHRERFDKQLQLLIDEGYFSQLLYNKDGRLTNAFIQSKFLRASYHIRKRTTAIPLDILCVPSQERMTYRVGLNAKNHQEVVQYATDEKYLAACESFGGVDEMNRLITENAHLLR